MQINYLSSPRRSDYGRCIQLILHSYHQVHSLLLLLLFSHILQYPSSQKNLLPHHSIYCQELNNLFLRYPQPFLCKNIAFSLYGLNINLKWLSHISLHSKSITFFTVSITSFLHTKHICNYCPDPRILEQIYFCILL